MDKRPENQAITLFAYDFPHRKSSDFLLEMFSAGLRNITVLAAPKRQLTHTDGRPYFPTLLRHAPPPAISDLCARLNLACHVIDHSDETRIAKLVRATGGSRGIIGGARIISPGVIRLFDGGIINFHPGKLPETSGLDASYYSVAKDVPPGVTTHFIDGRVDAGQQIWFDETPLGPDDSIEAVIENGYAVQREALRRLLRLIIEGKPIPCQPIDRPSKNEPMGFDQKWSAVAKFPAWRARQYLRQSTDALFEACATGSLVEAEKLLDLLPSLVHSRNSQFWTPLIVAAYNQHVPLVSMLLARGACASDAGRKGTTVLMYAKTKLLNQTGTDYRLLDILIDAGASISARDQFGKSVVEYVVQAGDERMARYLTSRLEEE